MALDLSGSTDELATNDFTKCVLISSEVVTLPGTNNILFYVSDVGK